MVLTFPHMGNIYIPLKAIFDDLGVESVVPPFCSRKTLDLGTAIAPETACLPLKINLGNFIEGMAAGADTFLLVGSCGPCRFGFYGVSEREILRDNGYDVDLVVIDPAGGKDALLQSLQKISGGARLLPGLRAGIRALSICQRTDALEKKVFHIRAREGEKGAADRLYDRFRKEALKKRGSGEMLAHIQMTDRLLDKIPLHRDARPIKIGVVGEIYTIIEPFTNFHLEQKLGAMGVQADRSMTAGAWIINKLFYRPFGTVADRALYEGARPYLNRCIGGHTQECIGHAVRYAGQGYDGVIEVMPFGCMPEIVSEAILPKVSREHGIPVLSVTVDEMTGETGFMTRIEAFLDMIAYKRKRRLS